jgi:hypothetical protein
MSKHVSPLLGYNNNVRHKNRVFHIQTEDSGVKHPHIITHLFMDGGRILKSIKRSYAEHVGADKMQETVKQMMKEQHKAMFISLRDGQFDHLVEDGGEKKVAKGASEPAVAVPPADLVMQTGPLAALPAAAASQVRMPTEPAPPPPPSSIDVDIDDHDMVPMTTRTPELMLDIDSLQNASAPGPGPSPRTLSDLPPPPANLFRDKSAASGAYRNATPSGDTKKTGSSPPKKPSILPPKKPASAPPRKTKDSDARYAAARPAAIFGAARPQQGSSIFGEDLISDKSLDEVILSYLAEDLEPPPPDKKK